MLALLLEHSFYIRSYSTNINSCSVFHGTWQDEYNGYSHYSCCGTICFECYDVTYDVCMSILLCLSVSIGSVCRCFFSLSPSLCVCFSLCFFFLLRQMPVLMKSDVKDNAARVLPLSAIMNRLKVDSALHKVLMPICIRRICVIAANKCFFLYRSLVRVRVCVYL